MELSIYDFFTSVYPDAIMNEVFTAIAGGSIKPPKTIFVPSKGMFKIMIETNLKFSKTDS
jgi:hypothetical protein